MIDLLNLLAEAEITYRLDALTYGVDIDLITTEIESILPTDKAIS